MVNPDHIRIGFDGSIYWVERKILTKGLRPDDPFQKEEGITTKWEHVYGYVEVDGWWTEDVKEDSNKEGVFVWQHYSKKEDALEAVRALCLHTTYFDVNGNVIPVASGNNSPYIMDEKAKRYYQERSKSLEELYGKGYKDKRT